MGSVLPKGTHKKRSISIPQRRRSKSVGRKSTIRERSVTSRNDTDKIQGPFVTRMCGGSERHNVNLWVCVGRRRTVRLRLDRDFSKEIRVGMVRWKGILT